MVTSIPIMTWGSTGLEHTVHAPLKKKTPKARGILRQPARSLSGPKVQYVHGTRRTLCPAPLNFIGDIGKAPQIEPSQFPSLRNNVRHNRLPSWAGSGSRCMAEQGRYTCVGGPSFADLRFGLSPYLSAINNQEIEIHNRYLHGPKANAIALEGKCSNMDL